MARPARVRMRRRKPWVFARRRLFGWNVRLLTRFSVTAQPSGGAVLKVVRGTWWDEGCCSSDGSTGWIEALISRNRRPAPTYSTARVTRACENGPQHRLGLKYGSQCCTVKLVWFVLVLPPNLTKTAYGGPADLSLSGDTPGNATFSERGLKTIQTRTTGPWPRPTHADGAIVDTVPHTSFSHTVCTVCG